MTEKEKHPYLEKYPLEKAYKYLVIGTMPPASQLPPGLKCKQKKKDNRNFIINYFYGNVASFWEIMKQIYPHSRFATIHDIRRWQDEYCIGITDTVMQCRRKDPCSYKDSDLIIDWEDYNHSLKPYILSNTDIIEKLIFTSGDNYNNALANFRIIMGDSFYKISNKIVRDLPSPSGGSNTSNFNSNTKTFGLSNALYDYLIYMNIPNDIEYVKKQWAIKQKTVKGEKVNRIPKNMLTRFKIWKYEQVFPSEKCIE